jgi:hypothetical protein
LHLGFQGGAARVKGCQAEDLSLVGLRLAPP